MSRTKAQRASLPRGEEDAPAGMVSEPWFRVPILKECRVETAEGPMSREPDTVRRLFFAAACFAICIAILPAQAAADVRDFIKWKPNGQLDYRLLLRRYMAVSSFRYGRNWYGYPYSAEGGLLNPVYYWAPAYRADPRTVP